MPVLITAIALRRISSEKGKDMQLFTYFARTAVVVLICMASIGFWRSCLNNEGPANATCAASEVNSLQKHGTTNWIKTDVPFGKWVDVLAVSEDGSLVIAGQGTLLFSSDDGRSWRNIDGGEGSYRSTVDGGESSTDLDQLGRPLPSSVAIKNLCSVESGVLTSVGRLYLKAVCEHTTQLWSIPTKSENEPWNVLSFTYKTDPSEGVYSVGHNLSVVGERVVIDANLPTGPALLTTADNGANWHPIWRGSADDTGIIGLSFLNHQDGWMLQGNGRLLRTKDGGLTWVRLSRLSEEFSRICTSIKFVESRSGFIVGLRGLLLSTGDGGITWQRQNVGTEHDLYKVLAADRKHVWVSGQKGSVLETSDGGSLWRAVKLGIENDIRFGLAVSGDGAWVISEGSIFRSPKTSK